MSLSKTVPRVSPRSEPGRGGGTAPPPAALERVAAARLPGGVNSPTRLLGPGGGRHTIYLDEGEGCRVRDVEGRWYVDLHMCAGAAMLGHRAAVLQEALRARLERGLCFAFSHPLEPLVAQGLADRFPGVERVRFVTSGTEAVASAVGAARAVTGRRRILAFRECYHGWIVARDPGVTWLSLGDTARLDRELTSGADPIAAVLIEPVPASNGVLPPDRALLERLRAWCDESGALLVFDEVITGFRMAYGGASSVLGITPDYITLGKALSGGFPLAAYGGSEHAMSGVSPAGTWYQGGTLAAHPLGLDAARVMLETLTPAVYDALEATGAALEEALATVRPGGAPMCLVRAGGMMSAYRGTSPPRSGAEAARAALRPFGPFHAAMLEEGVFLQAQPNKPMFLSTAHDAEAAALVRNAYVRAGSRLEA